MTPPQKKTWFSGNNFVDPKFIYLFPLGGVFFPQAEFQGVPLLTEVPCSVAVSPLSDDLCEFSSCQIHRIHGTGIGKPLFTYYMT